MANTFWDDIGPGLITAGANFFANKQANDEAQKRLKQAQGPLYNQAMNLASTTLNAGGNFDPKATAQERFDAQQKILAPTYDSQEQAILRRLQATGTGGLASYGAVPGTQQTPGQPINPQLAAFYAGKAGAQARSAYDAMTEGDQYLTNILNRSGMLQRQATGSFDTGKRQVDMIPPKSSQTMEMIKAALPAVTKAISGSGLFGKAADTVSGWVNDLLGNSSDPWGGANYIPDYNFDFSNPGDVFGQGSVYDSAAASDWWY